MAERGRGLLESGVFQWIASRSCRLRDREQAVAGRRRSQRPAARQRHRVADVNSLRQDLFSVPAADEECMTMPRGRTLDGVRLTAWLCSPVCIMFWRKHAETVLIQPGHTHPHL